MRVAQCVCYKADRSQGFGRTAAGKNGNVGLADKLLAEKRTVRIVMIFEDTDDVGMHESAAKTPFSLQRSTLSLIGSMFAAQELDRHLQIGSQIISQPDL